MSMFDGLNLKQSLKLFLLAAFAGLLGTGCRTYQEKNHVIEYWHRCDLPRAIAEAKTQAEENANNKDAVIWRLEQGTVLRAAGLYADSNIAFDQAQQKIDGYAQKAKVRVGQEAAALISNQANLDYEGRSYDGIMLNTYMALNYLAMGQSEKARPEIIHAYQRQQDAVEANRKRIEKTKEEAQQAKDKVEIEKAQNDPKLKGQIAGATANLDNIKTYADYVNPFTVYLDGLYFMANATGASDLERAHKSLERVATFAPENDYVKQDLAAVEGLIAGKPLQPTTYVIFETGCAPVRDQIRIDIPIIVYTVSYIGAAFPILRIQDNFTPYATASFGGNNFSTKQVANMDSIVAQDFKNEMPVVITKTIAATVTKGVAAYAANEAARQAGGDIGGLLSQIATAGYQLAVNIADTRTWTTLPEEFQVARFATPTDRKIDLTTPTGVKASIVIGDGLVNVVYAKSIIGGSPLMVSQFKLK